jgi:thiamine-phosphate pyrophosphorylase
MAIVGAGGACSAAEAIRGGADLVQVRAKELTSRELVALVREVIAEVGRADRVFVNSRPDIAELTGALGVHLPESGLDPRSVRRAFPRLLIGVSRHDRAGLERAAEDNADFIVVGPAFETPGKEESALGVARIAELLRGVKTPVLAVGGVAAGNVGALLAAGVRGVAAIRPFANPGTASTAAASLRKALDQGGSRETRGGEDR